jgi:hypothetical protein
MSATEKAYGQPFPSCQHRLQVLETVLVEESVEELPSGRVAKDRPPIRQKFALLISNGNFDDLRLARFG